jgi:methionine synthase II (cobalamin-independent)
MSVLDRLPAWATTGVGSLPHDDVEEAVAHVAAAYDVPFCPQLPRLDGDMIAEWLGADPRRCGWSPARDRERPRAWDALLAELDRTPPAHGVVKLQVTGPATLACALERERGAPSSRREALALAFELAAWLAANVADQVRALDARGLHALLVVDEPALHVFGTEGVERAWDPLRAVAPAWGLHLCGSVPWDVVERAEPGVLSFDLALAAPGEQATAVLRRLLGRGGRIAWGVIAPHRAEHELHGVRRLRYALERTGALGEQSLLTPSCGSGRMSVQRENELAAALAWLALRERRAAPGSGRPGRVSSGS